MRAAGQVDRVRAEINYVSNPPQAGDATLRFVTEDDDQSTMRTTPGRPMWIENARGMSTDLDREGFLLVPHVTAVADLDAIEEDQAVDQLYSDEMASLLREVTGASQVIMTGGGKKRYGESATDKWSRLANAKPARYPHADNTDASSRWLAEMMASFIPDVHLTECSRWALFNMWRCVTPPPQDIPLAVCDARSVAPADEVTVTAVTLTRGVGEVVHDTTGYQFNAEHRWYYFRGMTPYEVIVFKAYDTDQRRARRVPHSAFTDPSCPPGGPTRASVEMRALALFG